MKADFFYITPQSRDKSSDFGKAIFLPELTEGKANVENSETLEKIFRASRSEYLLIQISRDESFLFDSSPERFLTVAKNLRADFLYSDFILSKGVLQEYCETTDYSEGSVRDDFDFGKFVLVKRETLREYFAGNPQRLEFSAWYDFRLFVSRTGKIARIPEALYLSKQNETRASDENLFEYVRKEFREIQLEREKVFTEHLKKINAFLPPRTETVNYKTEKFPVTASVIISVKNRAETISDAINSALNQKTEFDYNVLVVDNYSTDGTSEIIEEIAKRNEKVVRILPKEKNLGIGGCWNVAVNDARCGAFAVQLDSDDVYLPDGSTLQKIIDKFFETGAAAVVGSYKVTDFELNEIPPGAVLHEEWTDENGHNNALRINGFGAPRAYYTPVVRRILFPNVSYGEDYAVMLAITRRYKIARIFEPVYFARRWRGNSDAGLDRRKKNRYDYYKDFLRGVEIAARRSE